MPNWALSEQITRIGSSKLGFFSKPVLLTQGTHAGKVMKSYTFVKNRVLCEELLHIHEDYILQLTSAGIKIPPTEAEMVQHKNSFSIRIYQQPFDESQMARKIMETGSLTTCMMVMNGILNEAVTALNFLEENKDVRMGFHPTLRNYAVKDDAFWYFDTFPPMAHISQQKLESYILHFSPYNTPGWFKKLAKPLMHHVTDEYYQADKMYLGIVGSSCRLRPEFQEIFLSLAQKRVENLKNNMHRNSILSKLQHPPKLPFIWTFTRKILGKEGKSNLKK